MGFGNLRRSDADAGSTADPWNEPAQGQPKKRSGILRRFRAQSSKDSKPLGTKTDEDKGHPKTSSNPSDRAEPPKEPMVLSKKPFTVTSTKQLPDSPSRQTLAEVPAGVNKGKKIAPIDSHVAYSGLVRQDVRALFFGAPYFMLEKGRHGRFFPQTIFPWNKHLEIADLSDRRYLRHESFALATLHAHLPVPDEQSLSHGSLQPIPHRPNWKGAAFEVGVFEMPNMLGFEGALPGTVGMRHFLEMPLADELRETQEVYPDEHDQHDPSKDILSVTFTKALRTMSDAATHVGKHAPPMDRAELIRHGPRAYKRLGIRDLSMEDVIGRLGLISLMHDHVVADLRRPVDFAFYDGLFKQVLQPPETDDMKDIHPLKLEIATLVRILATRGSWFDLSVVEWRIKMGQILWQDLDPRVKGEKSGSREHDAQRKWFLIQLLLAIELMIRLDAVIKLGIAKHSPGIDVTPEDIHQFNHLRNRKTDWDIVMARRFLDYFRFQAAPPTEDDQPLRYETFPAGIRARLNRTFSNTSHSLYADDPWKLSLIPRRSQVQVEGLLHFAQCIRWPQLEELERVLAKKLGDSPEQAAAVLCGHTKPFMGPSVRSPSSSPISELSTSKSSFVLESPNSKKQGTSTWSPGSKVILTKATSTDIGSWVSRSWFTGTVLPGRAISHFLIATLLENDPNCALDKLGEEASLWGGFVLNGGSWWSKYCVVHRVLGSLDASSDSMGWLNLPKVIPLLDNGEPYANGWVDIVTLSCSPSHEKARLFDGHKISVESSPLGIGQGKVSSREFAMPVLLSHEQAARTKVSFKALRLQSTSQTSGDAKVAMVEFVFKNDRSEAETVVQRSFRLRFDVYFVCAHPCRLPHACYASASSRQNHQEEALHAHPVHQSYPYKVLGVEELLADYTEEKLAEENKGIVRVIDARGGRDKDAFARAWCAEIGRHALVAKVGKVCVSCSLREARALDITIIIRVGPLVGSSHDSDLQ